MNSALRVGKKKKSQKRQMCERERANQMDT